MSCPICGNKVDAGETAMITIKDGVPTEVAHVQCWWTRRIRLRKLAEEETEAFGFAVSTSPRPRGQA
jgi:hypothetical protein